MFQRALPQKNCLGSKPPDPFFSAACQSNKTVLANTVLPIEEDMQHVNTPRFLT